MDTAGPDMRAYAIRTGYTFSHLQSASVYYLRFSVVFFTHYSYYTVMYAHSLKRKKLRYLFLHEESDEAAITDT